MKRESFNSLRDKEVINICDGKRLGYINDLEIDICDGKVCAIVVLFDCVGKNKLLWQRCGAGKYRH